MLADVIMDKIKKFRAIKDEDVKRFIEFVYIVAKGYRDLSRVKVDYELLNTAITSIIEEKLPKTIHKDWAKKTMKNAARWKNQRNFFHC